MKTPLEWAEVLLNARPSMLSGQDRETFLASFASIIETIQEETRADERARCIRVVESYEEQTRGGVAFEDSIGPVLREIVDRLQARALGVSR